MNLDIKITEVVNGYRLDISDWKANDFYKENIETLPELWEVLNTYLATYKDETMRIV